MITKAAVLELLCSIIIDPNSAKDALALTAEDWDSVITIAHDQGILPLLHHHFSQHDWPNSLPNTMRRKLQADFYNGAAQNLLFYQELRRILPSLAEVAPVVVLKGVALGTTLYPNPSLRPLHDLDLLVQQHDLVAAADVLRGLGYKTPAFVDRTVAAAHHHVVLQGGPRNGVVVELHGNLVGGEADWRSPPEDWYWKQTEIWQPRMGGIEACDGFCVLQLTPTCNLLYLAAHLMLQHGGAQTRLIWLYDLHLLLTTAPERFDWREIRRQAHRLRWSAALRAALLATQASFRTPLPADVLDGLRTEADAKAVAFVQDKAVAASAMRTMWLNLMSLQWRVRFHYAGRALFPSRRYMRWRYPVWPAWLWPLSYPYRWVCGLRNAALALLGSGHR